MEFPDAGHFIFSEEPAAFQAAIYDFLTTVYRKTPAARRTQSAALAALVTQAWLTDTAVTLETMVDGPKAVVSRFTPEKSPHSRSATTQGPLP
jgi:hypothetical protein